MHPEDRVLVGVIKRQKDLRIAREQRWYRIPEGKAPQGIYAQVVGFFLSHAFGKQNGGIHYYAQKTGHELATRAQLLPDEAAHRRAGEIYQKLQFGELRERIPPILNERKRRFAFILTTWDRFTVATTIDDLYSADDHLVDRIFYGLRDEGFRPQRRWTLATEYPPQSAQVRILCEDGDVVASTLTGEGIPISRDIDVTIEAIKHEIERKGGPARISVPAKP